MSEEFPTLAFIVKLRLTIMDLMCRKSETINFDNKIYICIYYFQNKGVPQSNFQCEIQQSWPKPEDRAFMKKVPL